MVAAVLPWRCQGVAAHSRRHLLDVRLAAVAGVCGRASSLTGAFRVGGGVGAARALGCVGARIRLVPVDPLLHTRGHLRAVLLSLTSREPVVERMITRAAGDDRGGPRMPHCLIEIVEVLIVVFQLVQLVFQVGDFVIRHLKRRVLFLHAVHQALYFSLQQLLSLQGLPMKCLRLSVALARLGLLVALLGILDFPLVKVLDCVGKGFSESVDIVALNVVVPGCEFLVKTTT